VCVRVLMRMYVWVCMCTCVCVCVCVYVCVCVMHASDKLPLHSLTAASKCAYTISFTPAHLEYDSVCVRVFMCSCVCMYECVHVYVCMYEFMCMYVWVCSCVCRVIWENMGFWQIAQPEMYVWVHVYVCMSVFMCMYVCMSSCVCMYVWVHVYVCLSSCVWVCLLILNMKPFFSEKWLLVKKAPQKWGLNTLLWGSYD